MASVSLKKLDNENTMGWLEMADNELFDHFSCQHMEYHRTMKVTLLFFKVLIMLPLLT
jgi:hypothetical protein